MHSDHNANAGRLYREIMREACLLGDKYLVEMVLVRLSNLTRPSIPSQSETNVISFPYERPETMPTLRPLQPLWITILRTAMIPFGMFLFLVVFHYASIFFSFPCQP